MSYISRLPVQRTHAFFSRVLSSLFPHPLLVLVYRNMWSVWRTVLEENEKLSRTRLAAIEVISQTIADDAKILRYQKLQTTKKVRNSLAHLLMTNISIFQDNQECRADPTERVDVVVCRVRAAPLFTSSTSQRMVAQKTRCGFHTRNLIIIFYGLVFEPAMLSY